MIHLDIQTVFVMVILISASLSLTIGWMARDNADGLRAFAGALGCHAVGYLLLALRGGIPDWISIVVANGLIGVAEALFLLAVRTFRGWRCHPALLAIPPLLVALGLSLSMDRIQDRIVIANGTFIVQNLLILRDLLRRPFPSPVRGRNLVACGVVVSIAMLAGRVWVALFHPDAVSAPFQSSAAQQVSYLLVFMVIVLIANGFLMMTKERSDAELRHAALRDRLTGCWNRTHLEEIVGREIARLQRHGHPVAAILVDIDHFKAINDRHGHDRGDAVLVAFARVARDSLRATDVLGRWGGEEFLVLLPTTGLTEAIATAERLRAAVAGHDFGIGAPVNVSLGVAACLSTDTWSDWFRRADRALYRAKTEGRNRTCADGVVLAECAAAETGGWVYQLIWRDAYLSGNAEIDRQHRALFASANRLLALGCGPRHDAAALEAVEAFLDETRAHFADEDRLLAAAHYADAERHAQTHAQLIHRAEHLLNLYRARRIDLPAIFHFVVHELFAQHILVDDHAFAPAFAPR